MALEGPVARGIAGISLWSSRHALLVVAATLVATAGLGYGVTLITTDVDVADVLPRGDPNTAAAHNLTDHFRSTFTQQVTLQIHVDAATGYANWERDAANLPYRATATDPQNATDEVYIRAVDELIRYIEQRTDFDRAISLSNLFALLNWTLAGGEDCQCPEAFGLPGADDPASALRYRAVHEATVTAIPDALDALASPSWNHTVVLLMPAADNDVHMRVLGQQVMDARDAYLRDVAAGRTQYTVFGPDNPPLFTVDLPIANAHSSQLVEGDLLRLMPIIGAFIVVCLFLAFRDVRAIAISFSALAVGVTWTYGTMGYMGIPLNTLNMTIVPLIMGVGIDYAIHMINEFLEHKSEGLSDDDAFRRAGGRAGLAMFIATLTTGLGLLVMMLSPSLLMAQLGFLSAVAIAAIYVLTIAFIPAALRLLGTRGMGQSFTPSTVMPAAARGVSRARWPVAVLVLLLTGGAFIGMQNIGTEAFGDPGRNFPKDHLLYGDDPVRAEHEQGLAHFYEIYDEEPDIKANILVFEGPNILTPEAMAYYRAIEEELQRPQIAGSASRIIPDTLRTVPFFIETWLTVKGGPHGALSQVLIGQLIDTGILPPQAQEQVEPFPQTEEGIKQEVAAMFASPMAELAALIMNHPVILEDPSRGMTAMTFSVRAGTYEEAEQVWTQVWAAVANADESFGGAPEGVRVAFVGNTATNYLFQAKELPWLTYMGYAATGILFILVLLFTGDIKATLVATGLAAVTTVWWLGLLSAMDIGLAITLMLPLVFIFNIGTDYVVHIIWNMRKVGDARTVFATTGKAIFFSALTTIGAFAIFMLIRNVAVSRTMVATTLAIGVIFVATVLVIPLFYPVQRAQRGP